MEIGSFPGLGLLTNPPWSVLTPEVMLLYMVYATAAAIVVPVVWTACAGCVNAFRLLLPETIGWLWPLLRVGAMLASVVCVSAGVQC